MEKKGLTYIPEPFAKALSVVCLSGKKETRCVDILTSEFYPFSLETEGLQNDILRSLPKVKIPDLKAFQSLVDPKTKVSPEALGLPLGNI